MKKWILNVGLTTITVLPIVAVASCSSTTTESPSLTTEVAKYENKTFPVKGTSTIKTPSAAIESINKGSNTEKLTALQALVSLNLDTKNFTFEDIKAEAGTNNTVSVSVKVIENANKSNSKTVKFVINGFTTGVESALDKEVQRFQKSEQANTASQSLKATDVITKINGASTDATKIEELENLTTFPKPNSGFELKVLSVQIGTEQTSVDVKLSIIQVGTQNKAEATFTITGFATLSAKEKLEAQASLLVTQKVPEDKKTETPLIASKAISSENLDSYYTKINLSDGITYVFASATPNTSTNTTLDVTLTVKSTDESVQEITKIVEITGFTSPQTLLDKEAELIVDQTVIASKTTETAKTAAAAITDTIKLKEYYAAIELAEGFSYALKSGSENVSVVGDTVRVIVTVSSEDTNTTPVDKTFTISGFKKEITVVAETFTTSIVTKNKAATTRQIIFGLNVTSDTPEKKIKALNAIVELPQIPDGFTIQVGEATQATANTSVNVALKILQTNTSNEADAIFTITTLTAETLQQEITRLATANLIDRKVLDAKKGETAEEAKNGITSIETLGQYYELIALPQGLKYVYKTDVAENDTVKVTVEVASSDTNSDTTAASKEFTISGFKTVALVNLEAEAEKLTNKTVIDSKNTETAIQAKSAIRNDQTLNAYYSQVSLGTNFGYKYGGKTEVNKTNNTILDITLKVVNRNVTPHLELFKVVQLSGFATATSIEVEALKFATSTPAKAPSTLTMGVISVINAIGENQANKLAALKAYATDFPTLGDAYTLSIGQAAPDAITPTSVNIPITISPKPAEATTRNAAVEQTPVIVTFTITNLTVGTPEQQLQTISMLLNDREVLSDRKSQTAAEAQKLLINDGALNQYYQQTTLPSGFGNNYAFKSEVDKTTPTTLNVTLKVINRNVDPNIEIFKVVKITGFAAQTEFEKEAQKFAISAPATTSGTLTTKVITDITSASSQAEKLTTLKTFATLPDTNGYTIVINTPIVDPSKNTSVIIPMTITKTVEGNTQAPTPVSVNFIITGLTVPTGV